jgi:hypothetical protein
MQRWGIKVIDLPWKKEFSPNEDLRDAQNSHLFAKNQ